MRAVYPSRLILLTEQRVGVALERPDQRSNPAPLDQAATAARPIVSEGRGDDGAGMMVLVVVPRAGSRVALRPARCARTIPHHRIALDLTPKTMFRTHNRSGAIIC
jgi:hypothetical protein